MKIYYIYIYIYKDKLFLEIILAVSQGSPEKQK